MREKDKAPKAKMKNESTAFQKNRNLAQRKANLILANVAQVDEALQALLAVIAQGTDWNELANIVKQQKKSGNPVASIIHELALEQNKVILLLRPSSDDMDEDDSSPPEKVEVNINLTAQANARSFFEEMKKAGAKEKLMTVPPAENGKKQKDHKEKHPTPQLTRCTRKRSWFEKFNWFISSQNYLIIGGHDAQQSELLVKRYLKPGDLYVHADMQGAIGFIIKNASGKDVPPISLSQAGAMCMCRSSAWENKNITSAWWVYHNQVSKTNSMGERLPVGSFLIRGKKNFLPPQPLLMGIGILFRVSDDSVPNHTHERRILVDTHSIHSADVQSQTRTLSRENSTDGEDTMIDPDDQYDDNKSMPESMGDAMSCDKSASALSDGGSEVNATVNWDEPPLSDRVTKTEEPALNTDFSRYSLVQHGYNAGLDESKGTAARTANQEQPTSTVSSKSSKATSSSQVPKPPVKKLAFMGKESGGSGEASGSGSKKRMSAKERRLMKKQATIQTKPTDNDINKKATLQQDDDENDDEGQTDASQLPTTQQDTQSTQDDGIASSSSTDAPAAPAYTTNYLNSRNGETEAEGTAEGTAEGDNNDFSLDILDALTGAPLASDTLLYAVPMCAPYSALSGYKYVVKMQPGTLKRAKAAMQIEKCFLNIKTATDVEKELIKQISSGEYISALLSGVKLLYSEKPR